MKAYRKRMKTQETCSSTPRARPQCLVLGLQITALHINMVNFRTPANQDRLMGSHPCPLHPSPHVHAFGSIC